MNNKIFLDTSALMRSISTLEILIEEKNTLVICSIVLEELDNLKTNKDENKAFKSRQAIKFIDKHQDNIEFLLKSYFTLLKLTMPPLEDANLLLFKSLK